MTNRHIIGRKLPERSYLTFNYIANGEVGRVVTLPFFEHIDVKESKKARFEKYNLLSRSSDLYSYLGADSRSFDLTFSMTLPHIIDSIKKFGALNYIEDLGSSDTLKELFKNPSSTLQGNSTVYDALYQYFVDDMLKSDVNYIANTEWGQKGITPYEKAKLIERYDAGATIADLNLQSEIQQSYKIPKYGSEAPTQSSINDGLVSQEEGKLKDKDSDKNQILETVVFWVNIIRTCVTNSADDVTDGPPLIRFSHGILYQDIPCICTDYSVSYDKMAGFDIDTLLPRKIDISMSLEEFRVGDFGVYEPGVAVKRDNLAGWESVFKKGTVDPGRIK